MAASTVSAAQVVATFDGSAEEWDCATEQLQGWTHFHRYGWRRVMQHALGHECVNLVARGEDGAITGLLPLVHVRSALFGHYLVSMPFLNYGGPLGCNGSIAALTDASLGIARETKPKMLEFRSRTPLSLEAPVSHRKVTVLLALRVVENPKIGPRAAIQKPQNRADATNGPSLVNAREKVIALG